MGFDERDFINYEKTITESYEKIAGISDRACRDMNAFSEKILRARGGRIGSGMGALLEALWGYMVNRILLDEGTSDCEIAWFPDNQYNDFACIKRNMVWEPDKRDNEYFRIEVKSMNTGADEPKAHFTALQEEIGEGDAVLILVWEWTKTDDFYCYPRVIDSFFGRARNLAELRDKLHIAKGGSFVRAEGCPDMCEPYLCRHIGEPLNASGKRERLSGPESTRPSENVSYAANFGGLVRMLKTENESAREIFRRIRKEDAEAHRYISFIHRNFPKEEKNGMGTSICMKSAGDTRGRAEPFTRLTIRLLIGSVLSSAAKYMGLILAAIGVRTRISVEHTPESIISLKYTLFRFGRSLPYRISPL